MRRQAMNNFRQTRIYAITGEELSAGRSNLEVVRQLIDAGILFLQYREKHKSTREMYEECRQIREMTRNAGVTFVINDRVDLALAVNADGVHVGQDDMPAGAVRRIIGPDKILGVSTNTLEELQIVQAEGWADYVGVGPVFATATKSDAAECVGLEHIRRVSREACIPFVAIGGINEGNLVRVIAAGAATAAIISDIVGASDIAAKVSRLREIVENKLHQQQV